MTGRTILALGMYIGLLELCYIVFTNLRTNASVSTMQIKYNKSSYCGTYTDIAFPPLELHQRLVK